MVMIDACARWSYAAEVVVVPIRWIVLMQVRHATLLPSSDLPESLVGLGCGHLHQLDFTAIFFSQRPDNTEDAACITFLIRTMSRMRWSSSQVPCLLCQ